MKKPDFKKISKTISLILRHDPSFIGIALDKEGWANTSELISGLQRKGLDVNLNLLKEVVSTNDKKRFAFSIDFSQIRANQGHSISVDLALEAKTPPEVLYHGTVSKFVSSIRKNGLQKMSRQHVHLSSDKNTAAKVGSRRGSPIILVINTFKMNQDGYTFYLSDNGVWLTDHVPAKYIT